MKKITGIFVMIVSGIISHLPLRADTYYVDSNFNPSTDGQVTCAVVQKNGQIVIGGNFTYVNGQPRRGVARLNPDGTLDTAFDASATVSNYFSVVKCLIVDPYRRVYIGGYTHTNDSLLGRLACVDVNGALYQNVYDDGSTDYAISEVNGPIFATPSDQQICIQNSDQWVDVPIAGWFSISCPKGDGTYCTNIDVYEILVSSFPNVCLAADVGEQYTNVVSGPVLSITGGAFNYVVGGGFPWDFENHNFLSYSPLNFITGDYNAGYSSSGTLVGGADGGVSVVQMQDDFKVVVGGEFSTIGNEYQIAPDGNTIGVHGLIARFNADGSVDETFNPPFVAPDPDGSSDRTGFNDYVFTILIQKNGKILAGGLNTMYWDGTNNYGLKRVNSDGSLDDKFNIGCDGNINRLTYYSENQVIVLGEFETVGGQGHTNIARIFPDGVHQTTQIGTGIGLSSDGFDTNYIVSGVDGLGTNAIPFISYSWVPDALSGLWISPVDATTGDVAAPSYAIVKYTRTIVGPGTISGWFSCDNNGQILINGVQIAATQNWGIQYDTTDYTLQTSFSANLPTGTNVVEFDVFNAGGPTGLIVDGTFNGGTE